ncbi:hypothetical protein FP744_10000189 [Trichoderma asperellum]
MTRPEGRTKDGFETQFGTNHVAHFLLINLLMPALLAGTNSERFSRVVVLSSVAHCFGEANFDNINFDGCYHPMATYTQRKMPIFFIYFGSHVQLIIGSLVVQRIIILVAVICR